METNPGAVIEVDMAHATAVSANTAAVVFLQPSSDLAVLASWRVKIDRAAGRVETGPAGAGDTRAFAEGGDDADGAELGAYLGKTRLESAGEAFFGIGIR